jgi:hypothetical protein
VFVHVVIRSSSLIPSPRRWAGDRTAEDTRFAEGASNPALVRYRQSVNVFCENNPEIANPLAPLYIDGEYLHL